MNEERRTQSEHRSEVERAAEVLYMAPTKGSNETWKDFCAKEAATLSAAGLLRTEADRLNAELAEAMVAYNKSCAPRAGATGHIDLSTEGPKRDRVWSALRAILDARKPSPRFAVGNGGAGMLYTVFEVGHPTDGIVGYFPSKSAATDYAAHMNAGEAK